jgi:hypothetical protein
MRVFAGLRGGGVRRAARLLAIRLMPNSVYPLHLHLAGEIDRDTALAWSVLDTFDMYGPAYDDPQTLRAFKRSVDALTGGAVLRCAPCGQGSTATARRQPDGARAP